MTKLTPTDVMTVIENIMRDVSQAKRANHVAAIKDVAQSLGLDPKNYDFFGYNVARWPSNLQRQETEIRFHVDFAHGDNPDHRLYGATFEEVRALLRYTPASCRVAFNTAKDSRVDRTGRRQTKLGPCIITKLPEVINAADYPHMLRLADKQAELAPKVDARGRKSYAKGNRY